MTKSFIIGKYIVTDGETVQRCPSYYAADYEKLALTPGEYDLHLSVETGFIMPMPKSVGAAIDAFRVEGKLYSGCGGLNYSSRDLPQESLVYHFSTYDFQLPKMVEEGKAILNPGFDLLLTDRIAFGKTLKWGEGLLA